MTPIEVKTVIDELYNVDLSNRSRKRPFSDYVKMYFYFSRTMTPSSLDNIGALVNRNHCTVLYHLQSAKDLIKLGNADLIDLKMEIEEALDIYQALNEFDGGELSKDGVDELLSTKFEILELKNTIEKLERKVEQNKNNRKVNSSFWRKKYDALKLKYSEVEME